MTHASRAELRAELLAKAPGWYSPAAHLLLPPLTAIAIAATALSRIQDLRLWQLAFVPGFLVFGNAIEWHAHRGLLHRRTRFLEKAYLHHTPQHHALYVSDAMAVHSARELRFVLLPGYGILAILAATSPVVLFFFAIREPNLAALWVASAVAYLLSYEWLHLACHLPESSWIARLPAIRRLRRPAPPRPGLDAALELQRDRAALGSREGNGPPLALPCPRRRRARPRTASPVGKPAPA